MCVAALQQLVGYHTEENHRARHGEIERTRNTQQVDQILQNLQQGRANQNADNRTFTATPITASTANAPSPTK